MESTSIPKTSEKLNILNQARRKTLMIIYKILKNQEFLELETKGISDGSGRDQTDGFIHLSTKSQLTGTLKKYFTEEKDLILMAIDSDPLGKNLKWEKSQQNELFPHLYSNLVFSDALWFAPIQFAGDKHVIPSGA